MAKPRTLVFGDDGSPPADIAWLWINNHRWPDWRVVAVTATMPEIGPPVAPELASLHPWDPPSPRRAFAETGIAQLESVTAVIDPRLALGDFSPVPDLTVVGPTGGGFLKELGLGSTADWLLHSIDGPLVIARSARPADRILVCVDGSSHARYAAGVLAGLPLAEGAEVTLLAVSEGAQDPEGGMADAATALEGSGAKVTTREAKGKPTPTILRQIEELDANLVVLGTRGNTALRRLWVGSTASAVARGAPCAVLAATEPDQPPLA